MHGLDRGECPAAFLRIREGFGFLEGFVADADRLGEPVLIEFGRLWFPPADGGDVFGGDGNRLEAGFRDGEGGGGRAQDLEADLLQGMGEEPALELDAGLDGARLRACGLSRAALAPSTRASSSRIETSRAAMSSRRSVSPSMRSVRKSGSSATRARSCSRSGCLASSSWLSANRGSRFMKPPAGVDPARRDAYGDRRGAVPCRMLEIHCGAPEIYSVLMNGFIALK
jgi:hypothetical protein